jgi:hypothetical protein
MKKRAEKAATSANSVISSFLSKGKKLVTSATGEGVEEADVEKVEYDFDSGSDDDLIEIRPHS